MKLVLYYYSLETQFENFSFPSFMPVAHLCPHNIKLKLQMTYTTQKVLSIVHMNENGMDKF